MSMDYTSTPQTGDEPSETPMFAPHPIWERSSKKKRGFGRSRAAPAAATVATTGPAMAASVDPDDAVLTSTMEHPMPYTGRTTTTKTRRSGGVSPLAIGAGVVALGALAAAGWYVTQPRDNTMATLTPGAPGEAALSGSPQAATMAATTPAAPAPKTVVTARASAPATTTTTTTRTTTRMAAASRVRPAPRPAAAASTGESIDASGTATLPAGPQPYSAVTSGSNAATTTTVNPPAAATPAVIPATPPVEPAPAPSASSATPATPAPETPATPETTPPQ